MKWMFNVVFFFIATALFAQNPLLKNELEKAYKFEYNLDYQSAKKTLAPVLKKQNLPANEKIFIASYLRFYDFLLGDSEDINTLNALINSIENLKNRTNYHSELLINLYSSRYHYIAYNKTWEESLEFALKGYESADFKKAKPETKTDYLYDLGYLYDKVGNSFEGIKFYKKSLAIYIKNNGEFSTEVALNYNNLAFAYANVYDQRNTIAYYTKAASIWEKVHKTVPDNNNYLITAYQNLAYQYLKYGDVEKAKIALNKLNDHYSKKYKGKATSKTAVEVKAKLNYALTNLRVLLAQNKANEAEVFSRIIENTVSSTENKSDWLTYQLQAYQELAEYFDQQKNDLKLNAFLQKGRTLAENNNATTNVAKFCFKLAQSSLKNKEFANAENYLLAAQENIDPKKFELIHYQLPLLRSQIFIAKKQYDKGRGDLKKLLTALTTNLNGKNHNFNNLRYSDVADLVDPAFINFFAECGNSFFELYKNSQNKSDLAGAEKLFRISAKLFKTYYLKGEYNAYLQETHEKISGGLLRIAGLSESDTAKKSALLNLIEQNASVHLLENYRQKTEKYILEKSDKSVKSLQNELHFYQSKQTINRTDAEKIAQLKVSIDSRKKAYTAAQQDFNNLNNKPFDIGEVRNKLTANQAIYKYYCAENAVFRLSLSRKDISVSEIGSASKLEKAVSLVTTGIKRRENPKSAILKLSAFLLPSAVAEEITIVPDGFLNYLPFEILEVSKTKKPLVALAQVSYAYSLPMWLLTKEQGAGKSSNLLAVAPDYSRSTAAESRNDLKRLPFAEQESAAVAQLFGGNRITGPQATKDAFIKEINRYNVFHLAMHAEVVEDAFEQSCLYFQNQQQLFFSDLYKLHFPAKLVVLSACETGTGSIKSGEGVMSLSRALTYAGVQSAVVSLWQVPDKETSEIMISFYQYLNEGKNKDQSLALAKRDFLQSNPMKNDPYYWAGFIISGDIKPLVRKAEYWQILAFGMFVLMTYYLIMRKWN